MGRNKKIEKTMEEDAYEELDGDFDDEGLDDEDADFDDFIV